MRKKEEGRRKEKGCEGGGREEGGKNGLQQGGYGNVKKSEVENDAV
jgi:hypothetical protein